MADTFTAHCFYCNKAMTLQGKWSPLIRYVCNEHHNIGTISATPTPPDSAQAWLADYAAYKADSYSPDSHLWKLANSAAPIIESQAATIARLTAELAALRQHHADVETSAHLLMNDYNEVKAQLAALQSKD